MCFVRISALAALLVACGTSGGGSSDAGAPGPNVASGEDERGSAGVPPTAAQYCQNLGYVLDAGQCRFPDGSSCEEWSFFRGQCGQPFSYCARHGGTIQSVTEDAGTFTAVHAVCTLAGKQCDEGTFMQTGTCG